MVKKIATVLLCGLILGGCNFKPQKSGIEIMSYPTAKVFIDSKEAGMTPYKNVTLKPGERNIRIEARNKSWSRKIDLKSDVNTVVSWEFGEGEKNDGGYLLYMEKTGNEKKAGLMVSASPDKAAVTIDGEIVGFSPLRIDDVTGGDKQVTISFPGYKSINLYIKTAKGYQLVIEAFMTEEKVEKNDENPLELVVEDLEPVTVNSLGKVIISETETGWLRVREAASSAGREIGKVKPEEEYNLLEEKAGWYKIDYEEDKEGWISASYADKLL